MNKINLTRAEKSQIINLVKKGFEIHYGEFSIKNSGDGYMTLRFENNFSYGLYLINLSGLSEIIKDLNDAISEINEDN